MPIYEYFCENCGHQLELLQSSSEEPLSMCPECNKPELKKLVSAAGFRLAGAGWYETDFKSDNKRNLTNQDKKDDASKKDKKDKKDDKKSTPPKTSNQATKTPSKSTD